MARKNKKKNNRQQNHQQQEKSVPFGGLNIETKQTIWGIVCIVLSLMFIFAGFKNAGPAGNFIYNIFEKFFGLGYFILPLILMILAGVFFASQSVKTIKIPFIGATIFTLAGLGLIEITVGRGGWLGKILGWLKYPFGKPFSIIIVIAIFLASLIAIFNIPLKRRKKEKPIEDFKIKIKEPQIPEGLEEEKPIAAKTDQTKKEQKPIPIKSKAIKIKGYTAPPFSLLRSSVEKPTAGDLRANANIIKRTLQNFGIEVEMGEICIGPTVTQYTLKPAEGVKLSRITALQNDLSLALAAHPLRIEAPIPGKSLVGIEVPNKSVALVKLRNMLSTEEFQTSKALLLVPLGRDVSNKARYINIAKMPHLLIAGATGTGKSVCIHTIITSLLFRNTPETLRFILIDPKRVELSHYEGIPHLLTPVITECKKALPALRWAISEMERRYGLLLANHSRDIESYNEKISKKDVDVLPYIIIIIDELADLMMQYGKEVEGAIVRLAQMSRATGIHLVISTQRPSVEVITGLIKANITSRIAFQVASQVDSRTILDSQGAEKLLGHGDMLYLAADTSKPVRLQGAFLTENEVNRVTNFIRKQDVNIESNFGLETTLKGQEILNNKAPNQDSINLDEYAYGEEDEKYEEALEVIKQFGKASASLLQRRLGIGYARAAKLLDILEEKGIIGPADGAKPREVFLSNSQVWKNTSTKESLLDSSDTENLLDDNNEQDDNNEKI